MLNWVYRETLNFCKLLWFCQKIRGTTLKFMFCQTEILLVALENPRLFYNSFRGQTEIGRFVVIIWDKVFKSRPSKICGRFYQNSISPWVIFENISFFDGTSPMKKKTILRRWYFYLLTFFNQILWNRLNQLLLFLSNEVFHGKSL